MSIYCSICGAVFKHVASLKYHLTNNVCTKPKKEDEQKQLRCPVCDKTFKGVTAMQYHIKRRVCEQVKPAVGPPWTCMLCGTLFNLKQSWYVHMRREACKKYPQKYGLNSSKTLIPKIELTEGTVNLNEQINESATSKTLIPKIELTEGTVNLNEQTIESSSSITLIPKIGLTEGTVNLNEQINESSISKTLIPKIELLEGTVNVNEQINS